MSTSTASPSEGGSIAIQMYMAPPPGPGRGRSSRKTLYITNAYFAPEDNFVELLIAAAGRGVDARLVPDTTG